MNPEYVALFFDGALKFSDPESLREDLMTREPQDWPDRVIEIDPVKESCRFVEITFCMSTGNLEII